MPFGPRRRGRGVVGTVATAAAAPPTAAAASAGDDMMQQLDQVAQLHLARMLTDDEFAAAKAKFLA